MLPPAPAGSPPAPDPSDTGSIGCGESGAFGVTSPPMASPASLRPLSGDSDAVADESVQPSKKKLGKRKNMNRDNFSWKAGVCDK